MGSSSSRHRRNNHAHQQQNHQNSNHHDHRHHHQNQQNPSLPSSSTTTQTHQVPSFTTSSDNTTTTSPTTAYNLVLTENRPIPSVNNSLSNTVIPSSLPQPPQQPQNYYFASNAPYNPYDYHHHNLPPPPRPYNGHGWTPYQYRHQPGFMPSPPPPPLVRQSDSNLVLVQQPRYVDHNQAKTVKNDVNVHKGSIKLVVDENNLDSYLVSFTFDAVIDGSITIFYFAKEGDNCKFTPLYPEIYMPRRIPFKKGSGQKFSQPSGTGIDLGFFELDQLSHPSNNEDIFPLVIFADGSSPLLPTSVSTEPDQPLPTTSTHAQITQAVLEKNNEGHFQVKVVKQILWIDGVRYELREIYGIGGSADAAFDDSDPGKECVICMTEPKDTAVLPCRHMCLCSGCAKELSLQSDRCPICRQPIRELMEIKFNKSHPQQRTTGAMNEDCLKPI